MEQLIRKLRSLTSDDQATYSCFAISTKRKVGMKIKLSTQCVRKFLKDCLNYLCDKKFSKMQLGEYPIATPKDFIETIEIKSTLIATELHGLLNIPFHVETNATNLSNYNAYMFTIETSEYRYYLFTKRNPFIAYKKKNFLFAMLNNNKYETIPDNTIRLVKHFDCIVLGDLCYMISMSGRNLLGIGNMTIENSLKNRQRLLETNIVRERDFELLVAYMRKPGKKQCLSEVNEDLMQTLSSVTPTIRINISQKYRLKIIEENGKCYVDISDEKKIEDLITTLTNKRGKNFEDETITTKSTFIKT